MASTQPSPEVYADKSRVKWIVLAISIFISAGTIFYTNILVRQLKEREQQQIQLFAKTLEYTITEVSGSNIYFITDQILFANKSIPTILTDQEDNIIDYRNIDIDSAKMSQESIQKTLNSRLKEMKSSYDPIPVTVADPLDEPIIYGYVNYTNSFLLVQLTYYPYVQLSVIAIFAFIAYMAFNYSKAAEQNQVWVGLAKETAHQLGTPISSLMAWMEFLKQDPVFKDKNLAEELDKDIKRLELITERFSSIGSIPVLKEENIHQLVGNSINYLRPRISTKVDISINALNEDITAKVNPPLFEWVLENLCKNAVDAMDGVGKIDIKILRGSESRIFIDIMDTGKGIPKSKIRSVFSPGFTTKQRGWGLGLALAKRIIENYHDGRIFVKSSEENMGTTFRISLPSSLVNYT